jgi:hypothetical protein
VFGKVFAAHEDVRPPHGVLRLHPNVDSYGRFPDEGKDRCISELKK